MRGTVTLEASEEPTDTEASNIVCDLKGITVSAPPGIMYPGFPSDVVPNLYPAKSLFTIEHMLVILYMCIGGLR